MTRRSTASPAMGKSMAPKATAMAKEQGPSIWTEESDWESNLESESEKLLGHFHPCDNRHNGCNHSQLHQDFRNYLCSWQLYDLETVCF